jgi:hypothetical protein
MSEQGRQVKEISYLSRDFTIKADVPRSVLAGLLDAAGKPQGISPRPLLGKSSTLQPYQLAELYGAGLIELPVNGQFKISSQFKEMADVLLNPRTNLTIRIWGKDNICAETNIQFPGHIIEGRGVTMNQGGTIYRLTAFVEKDDIISIAAPIIPDRLEAIQDFQFQCNIPLPAAIALFALIDLARQQAKTDPVTSARGDFTYSAQKVYDYIKAKWVFSGFNDLITYIAAAGSNFEIPDLAVVIRSLLTLADSGAFLRGRNDTFTLASVLLPLVAYSLEDVSGLQWQRITRLPSDELFYSNRIFIFFNKSLILQISPSLDNLIYVSGSSIREVHDFINDEIVKVPLMVASVKTAPGAKAEAPREEPVKNAPPGSRPQIHVNPADLLEKIDMLKGEMQSCQMELGKLGIRYKVGEFTADQYGEAVKKVQDKLSGLQVRMDELSKQVQ